MAEINGWYYEGPDYSVGIFGGGWVHGDCPEDDGEIDTLEDELATVKTERTGELKTYYLLTCTGCAKQQIVCDYDWDPDWPEEES